MFRIFFHTELPLESAYVARRVYAFAPQMGMPWSTVYKMVHKVLQLYPCKIKYVQELQHNPAAREFFAFGIPCMDGSAQILAREHFVDR